MCEKERVQRINKGKKPNPKRVRLTLVALLLHFELLGEILVFLPLDLRPDRAIVHEITRIANLLLVQVGLLEYLVFEEIIWSEHEEEFEAGLGLRTWQVLDANVGECLERLGVAVGDDLAEVDVCAEGSEPEFWDTGRGGLDVLGEASVVGIVFDRLLLASLHLLRRGLCRTGDDRMAALIQRLLESKIL